VTVSITCATNVQLEAEFMLWHQSAHYVGCLTRNSPRLHRFSAHRKLSDFSLTFCIFSDISLNIWQFSDFSSFPEKVVTMYCLTSQIILTNCCDVWCQVMEVAVDGEMLQSFGTARDDDQLRWPWYVVVDQDSDTDAFLVADRNNYRVLHLSCDLRPTGVVIDDQGPTRLSPSRLSLVGDRLLIGHSSCVDVFTLR